MVHTDTDSRMIGLADIQKRDETVAYLPEFLCIFFIGILQMLESTCGVYVVARVDTDFSAYCAATSATFGLKCTSATNGVM